MRERNTEISKGQLPISFRDEQLARHGSKNIQNPIIEHFPRANLLFHHIEACLFEIKFSHVHIRSSAVFSVVDRVWGRLAGKPRARKGYEVSICHARDCVGLTARKDSSTVGIAWVATQIQARTMKRGCRCGVYPWRRLRQTLRT